MATLTLGPSDILQVKHPDIDWVPSFQAYLDRTQRRLREESLQTNLPQGFPQQVQPRMNWAPNDIATEEIVQSLTLADVKEIEEALVHFKGLSLTKDDISSETFPLPRLRPRLETVANEIHNGRGVVILRGLDPNRYTLEDNVILYAGIASYIGEKRGVQDDDGNVLIHVKDVGNSVAPDNIRQSPYTNNAQPFHNDTCDVLCMYAMDRSKTGGRSMLASTAYVYNEIAAFRPDLIHVLSENAWPFDAHTDPPTFYRRPILFHESDAGRISLCFSRRPLTGSATAPRDTHIPPLTEAQAEALDAVHFVALKHSIALQLEKGDIQFINNLGLLHAREAFNDEQNVAQRHMIRLWVRNEKLAWATPAGLQERWKAHYGGLFKPVWEMTHDFGHVIKRRSSCIG